MKKLLLVLMLAVCSISLWAKDLQTAVFTLEPPMHCQNCENKVQSNLRFEKGIKSIDASAQRGDVIVKFDPAKTNPQAIAKAFDKIGYKATVKKDNAAATCSEGQSRRGQSASLKDGQCAKKKDSTKK